ncbi:hypothetical protein AnigIFM60653_002592 [Aspergillus niger]|nr:hypothetical protein AnigIFM60653_002592 [Aspergillus niger]
MNLLQKFEHGSFFGLVGPDMTDKEGGGVCWEEEKVRSIDGIEEVGLVTYDNEAIIESYPDHKQHLRRLLLFVCDSRLWALKYAINKSHGRMFKTGWAGAMVSGLGVFGSALLVGAAPVVFPIACVGSCTFGLGSGILGSWRSGRVGAKEYPEWRRRSEKLEQQFPQLRELIGE